MCIRDSLYTALSEAKTQQQVYYRTDHHWTWYGAHTAYKAVSYTHLSQSFTRPRSKPRRVI